MCQYILCVNCGYHVCRHCSLLFNKAWIGRQTHRDAKQNNAYDSDMNLDTDKTNNTNHHVGKRSSATRCPDIFGVRIPNNGRVLAATISHQVVHVALPGHICEIISTIKQMRTVKLSDKDLLCGEEAVLLVV